VTTHEHWIEFFEKSFQDMSESDPLYMSLMTCFYAGMARGLHESQDLLSKKCTEFIEDSSFVRAGFTEPVRGPLS